MDSQNDSTMQYGHIPMQDRRDNNLDSNGSTPFQTHQSLGQALGNHLAPQSYPRSAQDPYRHPSTSPPTLNHVAASAQNHAGPSAPHQPISFAVTSGQPSPALKRKQMDGPISSQMKRRRDGDDMDGYDMDGTGQGAKHWTDDEKSKLFRWLMGPNSDEHWNALRATKNSCLRECALEVFEGKKTYQALKGCYERNFNLFKQIYALEQYHGHPGVVPSQSEPDRLREYERRLQLARKAGCDVGNITARTIEHWYGRSWYELFYRRWHGDPATTKPVQVRSSTAGPGTHGQHAGDDADDDDTTGATTTIDFAPDPTLLVNGLNGLSSSHDRPPPPHQVNFINPQSLGGGREVPQMPPTPSTATGGGSVPLSASSSSALPNVGGGGGPSGAQPPPPGMQNVNHPHHSHAHAQQHPGSSAGGAGGMLTGDAAPMMSLSVTPAMHNAFMQFIQVQTQASKMKMEYLRRREEREEKEHRTRYEMERLKLEKEKHEFEQNKRSGINGPKTERALELIGRQDLDVKVKQAASEYLRRMFIED